MSLSVEDTLCMHMYMCMCLNHLNRFSLYSRVASAKYAL